MDNDDSTIGTCVILDARGKTIAKKEVALERRVHSGNLSAGRGGRNVHLPGQLDCDFFATYPYNLQSFRFSRVGNVVRKLNVRYLIASPDVEPFLHPCDITKGLSRYQGKQIDFEDYFYPPIANGRHVLNDFALGRINHTYVKKN